VKGSSRRRRRRRSKRGKENIGRSVIVTFSKGTKKVEEEDEEIREIRKTVFIA